jgi:hypothetical protein
VGYAIIGGIAASVYGVTRVTKDADLVLGLGREDGEAIDRFLAALAAEGFRVDPRAAKRRLEQGRFILTAYIGLTRADFLLKRPDAYWQSALDRRRRLTYEGRSLWFASPEDVTALKLVAGRPLDLADIRRILAVQRDAIDRARLRAVVGRLAANSRRPELPGELERHLAEADALPGVPDERAGDPT